MNSKFVSLMKKESNFGGLRVLAVAAIAGLAQGLVMVIINGAANNFPEGGLNLRYFLLFVMCIAAFIYTKKYSLGHSVELVQQVIFNTRIRISDKIRRCSLISFESFGKSKIQTTLVENTEIIFEASKHFVQACSATVMLTFSFIYIGILSSPAFIISVVLIICAVAIYLSNQRSINQNLRHFVEKETKFFDSLDHLLGGFKEIKMNRERSDDLFENYLKNISNLTKELKIQIEMQFVNNSLFAETFFYVLMASIIFLLPQISQTKPGVIVNITSIILFIIGSLGNVVEAIPFITKADMAIENLEQIESFLDEADDNKYTSPDSRINQKKSFKEIVLKDVVFRYADAHGQNAFAIGPIDLTIQAGEMLFIVGGNGSGKSTLLKTITGLYYPFTGSIRIDNSLVDMTNYAHYRKFFSAIFADFHLFDRLYGIKEVDQDKIEDLLAQMQLSAKTSFVDGEFTNLNLSTGQRKRIALISSYLEDREIFVFDEIAADQDPIFRKYLYEVFLKELQAQGKTIIAVTHDDRYFDVANRVLKMEYGKLMHVGEV
ncbi:MAG: cyclic peptide export ABC transporter [Deltaproteobacteria bacterium]|nr:cyclic peptide export ABC transporter [Deltaproteobacteria bacterium]